MLSSDLDSTVLVGLVAEAGHRPRTVTLGIAEYRGTASDETPLAEAVARHYGAEHRTIWITREELREQVPNIISRMDQPTIDGVTSYLVSRAAASTGLKVALSGIGGDVLFGESRGLGQIPRLVSTVRRMPGARLLGRALRTAITPLLGDRLSPRYVSLLEYGSSYEDAYLLRRALFLPWELPTVLDPEMAHEGLEALKTSATLKETAALPTTGFHKVAALSASHHMRNQVLRDTDWSSMSHSLEVRTPFIDWKLWESVSSLTVGGRPLGKDALAGVARPPMPLEVRRRPSARYSMPMRGWMLDRADVTVQGGLRGWARYVYARCTGGSTDWIGSGRRFPGSAMVEK
jgi:asparagine synthase (glutamine-hydrolysing)